MKQLLLSLISILFISVSTYSQVANTPSDLHVCDDPYDGFAMFDLTQQNSDILGNQSPSDFTVTYYEDSGHTLQIVNPTAYINTTPTIQAIYARVLENSSGNFAITSFSILTVSLPSVGIISNLNVCDNTDINWSAIASEIANGNNLMKVIFYETLADAENNTNSLGLGYQDVTNGQTIYVRVENISYGCYIISSFQVYVLESPIISFPTPLELCDDISANGTETFDLSSKNSEIIGGGLTDVLITYHLTYGDAWSNINYLSLSYNNVTNPQTVLARVQNVSGCYVITTLDLIVQDCRDEDSDGVINSDEDINGNGNLDDDDTDGDGTPDYLDDDDDGDNIDTADELIDQSSTGKAINSSKTSSNTIIDTDGDTIENYIDDDDDGDGIHTKDEDYNNNGTPLDDDTNGNSVPDYLENSVALSVDDFTSAPFSVYPNPTKEVVYIATKARGVNIEKIAVYSITGELLLEDREPSKEINLDQFPRGMYFLNIVSDSSSFTKKIVKK